MMLWRVVWLSLLLSAVALPIDQAAQNEKLAQRLWEQMISAKGGRERLWSVRTLLERWVTRYRSETFKDGKVRSDALCALPDRLWEWSDFRLFGFNLDVWNFKADVHYFRRYHRGPPSGVLTYMEVAKEYKLRVMRRLQLVYLNETEWLKPKPVGVLKGKGVPRGVDAIQTMADGARVDFYLNRRTHLPAAIIDYHHDYGEGPNDPSGGHRYVLSRYVLIDGIRAPTVIDGGRPYEIVFNPSYREDTFTTAPFEEEGPEGWKPDKAAVHKTLLEQHRVMPVPKMQFAVEPSSGAGTQQTFRLSAARSDGVERVNKVGLTIGGSQSLWCAIEVDLRTRQLALKNAVEEITRSHKHRVYELTGALGSVQPLENEDCRIELSGASVSIAGGEIQVTAPITFKPACAAKYWIIGSAFADDDWYFVSVKVGVWTVPSSPDGPEGMDWTKLPPRL
jgi:hypothetical protein